MFSPLRGSLASLVLVLTLAATGATQPAAPPRVVEMTPENGAADVPPGRTEIVVRFSEPMMDASWSVTGGGRTFPTIESIAYDETCTVLTVKVVLRPGQAYRFGLNSASHRNFRSRKGVPLVPVLVTFTTAGEPAPGAEPRARGPKVEFDLEDVHGVRVRSEDYEGVPLFIAFGAAWCGGCQQEAVPFEHLARHYAGKGVRSLHVLSGENPRTGLDFRKHYRSRVPHLLDPARRFERRHSRSGWPFYLVADAEGRVVLAKTTLLSRDPSVRRALEAVAGGKPAKTVRYRGVDYLATTAKSNGLSSRTDRWAPDLVASGERLHVLFATNDPEGDEIRLRIPGPDGTPSKEERILSSGCPDAYDAAAVPDGVGGIRVFFTGLAPSRRYDVFGVRVAPDGAVTDPVNLTSSQDDAMWPAAVRDASGHTWLTYYRWHRMGFASRDKEVYARRFDGKTWSEEMRLSPADLPIYEDHTDPALAAAPGGGVVAAWAWDIHRSEIPAYRRYATEFQAETPTIFGRRLDAESGVGDLLFLGEAGMDGPPALRFTEDGRLWCAWSALSFEMRPTRSLVVSETQAGARDRRDQQVLESGLLDIGNPRFVPGGDRPEVVWASRDDEGSWSLKASTFDGEWWTKPRVLVAEGNPRFPRLARDGKDRVWLAYVAGPLSKRRVVVRGYPE